MKTKQITLEDVQTKDQLQNYIIDIIKSDIKWAIENENYSEPNDEIIQELLAETLDTMCIYRYDCKKFIKILEEQNDFDIFSDDNSFGSIPSSYEQAAYIALYDLANEIIYSEVYNSW